MHYTSIDISNAETKTLNVWHYQKQLHCSMVNPKWFCFWLSKLETLPGDLSRKKFLLCLTVITKVTEGQTNCPLNLQTTANHSYSVLERARNIANFLAKTVFYNAAPSARGKCITQRETSCSVFLSSKLWSRML